MPKPSSELDVLEQLKADFAPPLSPTLITALLLDHSPENPESLPRIWETLQLLAESATIENALRESSANGENPGNNDFEVSDSSDEAAVQRALEDWSLYSTYESDGASSSGTPPTSCDGWSDQKDDNETSPFDFLRGLFPALSDETLTDALQDDPDLSDVVESLMSLDLIREAQERGTWAREENKAGEANEDSAEAWGGKSQAAERNPDWMDGVDVIRQPGKGSASLSYVSYGNKTPGWLPSKGPQQSRRLQKQGVPSSPSLPWPQASPLPGKVMLLSTQRKRHLPASALTIDNAWQAPSPLALSLASLLPPATAAFFDIHLRHPSYSTPQAALIGALEDLCLELPTRVVDAHDKGFHDLVSILLSDNFDPDSWDECRERMRVVWRAARQDLGHSLDVWQILEDVKSKPLISVVQHALPSHVPLPELRSVSPTFSSSSISSVPSPILPPSPLPSHGSAIHTLAASSSSASSTTSPKPSDSVPVCSASVPVGATSSSAALSASAAASPRYVHAQPVSSFLSPLSTAPTAPSSSSPNTSRKKKPKRTISQKQHNLQNQWNPANGNSTSSSRPGTPSRTKTKKSAIPPDQVHPLAASIPAYANVRFDPMSSSSGSSAAEWLNLQESEELLRAKSQQACRDATRHYKAGTKGNRGGEVAAHYAETARNQMEAARRAGVNTSRARLIATGKYTLNRIDLHGLTTYESLVIVTEAVNAWWDVRNRLECPSDGSSFSIVTGQGNHSAGGKSVLRPVIYRHLTQEGWRVSTGTAGCIVVLSPSR